MKDVFGFGGCEVAGLGEPARYLVEVVSWFDWFGFFGWEVGGVVDGFAPVVEVPVVGVGLGHGVLAEFIGGFAVGVVGAGFGCFVGGAG